ncbi:hypothetical protein IFM46972_06341 [Aspergillus udagawae]|uniref:Pesticidal crystal protein cry6Aa n=1 Tax=Aspergillus udagawae TaxID=91492 RepID=A0A8H3RWW6_9EURO|nr:hypothetical protein IFM46972_06341 [Aspergillus udagawae]
MAPDIKAFYADTNFTTTVTGHPGGEVKKADVFILSHPDIMNLMRYVWAGCYLPTEHDEYVRRMGIDESVKGDVTKEIDLMVKAYADIQKDNKNFRDKTWQGLVNLAGDIKNFAKKAGGTTKSSYYAAFLKAIKEWNDENKKPSPDKTKLDHQRNIVKVFTEDMIKRITQLQTSSEQARKDLDTFKNASTTHSSTLQTNEEEVKKLLDDGEIKKLEGEIKSLQKELAAEHDELSYDIKVAATTPAYAWCTVFGFIAAISVATAYGLKIKKIKENIEETESKINTDQKKLKADRIVSADAQRMADGASALVNLIGPAIKALQKLETVWQTITADLKGLKEAAEDPGKDIPDIDIEEVMLEGLIESWNDLGKYVGQYVDQAYISEPEMITLKKWVEEYGTKH